MSIFKIIDSISLTKVDLLRSEMISEKEYNAWMVNKHFSFFADSIFDSAEMNKRSKIDPLMHYDYLRGSLRKAKRFARWPKRIESEDVLMIAERYQISLNNAKAALKVLTKEQLDELRTHSKKGGIEDKNGKTK